MLNSLQPGIIRSNIFHTKRAQVDLEEKLGEEAFFAYAYYVIRHFVNSNGPGLEPVDHTRPTYRRRGWPRGLGALDSSPHS